MTCTPPPPLAWLKHPRPAPQPPATGSPAGVSAALARNLRWGMRSAGGSRCFAAAGTRCGSLAAPGVNGVIPPSFLPQAAALPC